MEPGTTRFEILVALLKGPLTAQEAGAVTGVDTAAARRHLENLAEPGLVAPLFRQEGMGRPKKYYEVTDAGREALPRRYGDFLEMMAAAVVARDGEGALRDVMLRVAETFADAYAPRVPADAPLKERVRAVAGVLRALGFPTEVEERDGRVVIVRRDCVFLRVARAHPDAVCGGFDTLFLSRLLGEDVRMEACLPHGASACRHAIEQPAARQL